MNYSIFLLQWLFSAIFFSLLLCYMLGQVFLCSVFIWSTNDSVKCKFVMSRRYWIFCGFFLVASMHGRWKNFQMKLLSIACFTIKNEWRTSLSEFNWVVPTVALQVNQWKQERSQSKQRKVLRSPRKTSIRICSSVWIFRLNAGEYHESNENERFFRLFGTIKVSGFNVWKPHSPKTFNLQFKLSIEKVIKKNPKKINFLWEPSDSY